MSSPNDVDWGNMSLIFVGDGDWDSSTRNREAVHNCSSSMEVLRDISVVLQHVGNSTKDKIRKGKIHSDCNDTFVEIYIVV